MKIVVGLGNPGKQYEGTRHNVGWMVLDRIADRARWGGRVKARDAAAVVFGRYRGLDLMLVKPTTYMNESGIAVRKVLARERAPLDDLLVVLDDFALPFGRLRMRESGSAGTHNGLRSIIGELESERFARLRIGIGDPRRRATEHVLSRFAQDERAALEEVLDAAADAVEDWAREGASKSANKWNRWLPAEVAADERADLDGQDGDEPGDSVAAGGRLATPGKSADPGKSASPARGPGADGQVVRTRTGWRRLLPG